MAGSEHASLARVRGRAFLGALLAGLVAGALAAHHAGDGWLLTGASGVMLVLLGGGMGGFAGTFVRLAWLHLRGAAGGAGDDDGYGTEGVLVLSAYGAFLGLVATLALGLPARAHLLAGAGAFLGGAVAALLGRAGQVLLALLVLDGLDDAARTRALRRANEDTRRALLPPDDEDGPGRP
jgi:hypothetical protein